MKGGVTSGIAYPLAVCSLAEKYRFVNIGGTSAGAIAAAITAAAEYRRAHGDVRGFAEDVKGLPHELARRLPDGSTRLLSLFQPNPSTRSIFSALLNVVKGRGLTKVFRSLQAIVTMVPKVSWLSVLILAGALFLMWLCVQLLHPVAAVLLVLLLCVATWTIPLLLVVACARKIIAAVVNNKFGLCTGYLSHRPQGTEPPLTEWLAELLDKTAGKPTGAPPLTFGDLWGVAKRGAKGRPKINLQMMTTNLTQGRPYQLPFEQKNLYWDPEEFAEFFPERITSWMKAHSEPYADGRRYRLPDADYLPVIVAVRLSLSFPVLISAVPIWSADYSRKKNKQLEAAGQPVELERSWFSDGGICSNFPVHLFDSPLPRWPTFAINLRPFHPDYPPSNNERQNIWMPKDNGQGRHEEWVRFDAGSPLSSFSGFLKALLDTMQNWIDNTQIKIPGYRDRIAHIYLTEKEGGLNLEMEEGAIERICTRGEYAGELLRDRFTGAMPSCVLDWDNHRWVRYRSTITLMEKYLHDFTRPYRVPALDDERSYEALVARRGTARPSSYRWKAGQQRLAVAMGRRLMELVAKWDGYHEELSKGTPRPVPELRARPKL
jgi:predicted acylesterase/phospholipase RssA